MVFIFLFIQSAFALCPTEISPDQLSQNLDSMSVAFSARNIDLLEKYYQKNTELLPCIKETIPLGTAYRYHLFTGMYFWVSQENELAKQSFSTSKQIDSTTTINEFLFPEDHPIHKTYNNVILAGIEPVKQEGKYLYYFDGRQINVRPQNAPTIFQVSQKNKVIYTTYLESNAPLPMHPFSQSPKKPKNQLEETPKKISLTPYILVGLSGVMIGGSQYTANQFRNKKASDTLYFSNQALFFSSIATASVAGALFIKERLSKSKKKKQ